MSILSQLSDNKGARKSRTRICRGIGSGKGKTGGRGVKGQKSRSGVAIKGFEGGQMPIHRRLPKRGFNNYSRKDFEVLNLSNIQKFVDSGKIDTKKSVTKQALVEAGVIHGDKDGLKILAKGEIKAKITIEADKASEAAIKAIEKAGGKVSIIEAKKVKKAEDKKEAKSEKKSSK